VAITGVDDQLGIAGAILLHIANREDIIVADNFLLENEAVLLFS
jgi:hypothetical protein